MKSVEVAELFVCLLSIAGCAVTAIRCGSKLPADLAQFDALMTDLTLPVTGKWKGERGDRRKDMRRAG